MAYPVQLRTPRLQARRLVADDLEPLAALVGDPKVMAYFPSVLDRSEAQAFIARADEHWRRHGFGWWSLRTIADDRFVGIVGLLKASFEAAFTPCVEIGWRLAPVNWGQGYATEGANAALGAGFEELALDEIVAFATVANMRSRAVMDRLGMARDEAHDFQHPSLAEGHPLRPHVLYRATAHDWTALRPG